MKRYMYLSLLTVLIVSCNNNRTSSPKMANKTAEAASLKIDSVGIVHALQGVWKETGYPFRTAEFKDAAVKFIEEGVAEKPEFKTFTVSGRCPYTVNNIRDVRSNDLFLVLTGDERCEKLKISGDTLSLSGFNVSSNRNYNIVYIRVKE